MKKVLLVMAVITITASVQQATAQVRLNVNVNLGSQPAWGPAGYDYVEYYYLPDLDIYYYVPSRQYVYMTNGRWIFSSSLPARYRSYNLYSGYKVVINEPRPYMNHQLYQSRYARYKGWNGKQSANNGNGKYKEYKNHGRGHGNH